MRRLILGAFAALTLAGAASAADFEGLTVSGKAQPWQWATGGLNDAYMFGVNDGAGPAVFNFADLGIGVGDTFHVLYIKGTTDAFCGGACSIATNTGYVASPFKDDDPGSSGNHFPGHYLPGEWSADPNEGLFLNALIGATANDLGEVQSVFSVGSVLAGGVQQIEYFGTRAAGATRLQFGVNDDIFADNGGALTICVDKGTTACADHDFAAVPEPASWALMIAGFGLAGAALRSRRRLAI
ncbi:PEPxxWA-CTERM sorting domain-containing protein [Phenylobacterium sp.]|uniref:PEPxxWA-CTERM sorting domain-containing protein n=1 Tax=Phenylobacterium sp. TaxID=1871053 RepID=UPI0026001492|nr:PEPxxWA-CTERM sorting domain-containing protein [Phenylobacterium sp.]